MNTDCRNGRTFGGCWGTNQILFHDLWSQLNTEWSNLVETRLLMKLRPPSPFFPVFQGEGRCWQLGSGLDAPITHPLTYKPSLCCPFITYSHRKARKKRRNARGRLRFCADWKMASCAYRQCKSIWLESFDATHQLGWKKRKLFQKAESFFCLSNSNHQACNFVSPIGRIWNTAAETGPYFSFPPPILWSYFSKQTANYYYLSPHLIEALIYRASVVDRNAVSTLANEIQSLLLCRLCGSCQRREPFLSTCFTLKAITSLNRLNLKARGCFMKRDRGENKPTNRRKGARRRL